MRLLLTVLLGVLAGCFLTGGPLSAQPTETGKPKILIVYFSKTNNTKAVAEHIQSIVGGDLLELKTARPYPEDHDETVRIAVEERRADARPELATVFPENMADYDVIFAGYPVWEYTMPMAYFTFFDRFKFAGKTIIPFSTHLGSRLGGGPADMARLCPEATILKGLALRGPEAAGSRAAVERWLKEIGIAAN